jgi:hypothetical protein
MIGITHRHIEPLRLSPLIPPIKADRSDDCLPFGKLGQIAFKPHRHAHDFIFRRRKTFSQPQAQITQELDRQYLITEDMIKSIHNCHYFQIFMAPQLLVAL